VIKRALISVYDKAGIAAFARTLSRRGVELIASGGTARALREKGIDVCPVSDVTGCPEILDGRVKTLHPAIHGGILSRRTPTDRGELESHGWGEIDLVVVNLYPFEAAASDPHAAEEDVIEQIDIGGVALLRAAAKAFAHVAVVCDPGDYAGVVDELDTHGEVLPETRRRLAAKAFARTAAYDEAIGRWASRRSWSGRDTLMPNRLVLGFGKWSDLRYGENPHQRAALYVQRGNPLRDAKRAQRPVPGPLGAELLQGKPLSYNNLLDLDAAWRAVTAFGRPTVVIVKHLSPCGMASADTVAEAFPLALAGDPVSAFGSVVAVNRSFDEDTARALGDLFVEGIAAPDFTVGAQRALGPDQSRSPGVANRGNCRLLRMVPAVNDGLELRSVRGGLLVQEHDPGDRADWCIVTDRRPSDEEMAALQFAWRAVAHVKSNAILLARGEAAVGIGGGLPSRVDAVRLAVAKAGARAAGAVMASDAFFPFSDGVQVAAEAGVTAVVQPGGSVRDEEVIEAADRLGLAMCLTGVRHFRH
jgi:phosphoribosylaminoimidazolecarboxamide formyltransferase/IMP cyclohydrolase